MTSSPEVVSSRANRKSANYHVFKDTTGFKYDCTLTKVDTLTNRNERLVLTVSCHLAKVLLFCFNEGLLTSRVKLYESNNGVPETDNPPTYATNLHFAGTGKQPRNNILAVFGSNRLTAIRMWCKAFKEQTGVDWDDRIKAHNERVRARARDGDTPGLYSTRRGEDGDIRSKTRAAEDAVPFEKRKFEYMPPLHAARGWLPHGVEQVPEVLRQMRTKPSEQRERTEQWMMMSGGNGFGPEGPSSSPRQSIEEARPVQIDLTEDGPADELDEPVTPASRNGCNDDATGATFGATTNVAATGVNNGGLSSGMETRAYVDNLLASAHDFSAQDKLFNVGDLADQQQQHFNFDQDDFDFGFGNQQPGVGFVTENGGVSSDDLDNMNAAAVAGNGNSQITMPAGRSFDFSASYPDQTQLATKIGQDLLGLGGVDGTGVSGCVVPEAEQLEAAAGVEKRKREAAETGEDLEPASKRFLDEGSEDGEIAA